LNFQKQPRIRVGFYKLTVLVGPRIQTFGKPFWLQEVAHGDIDYFSSVNLEHHGIVLDLVYHKRQDLSLNLLIYPLKNYTLPDTGLSATGQTSMK